MTSTPSDWLFLISTLPGQNGALRIRFWRTLRGLGAGTVRDGVYALPDGPAFREAFEALRNDIVQSNGTAYIVSVIPQGDGDEAALRALFDRSEQYGALIGKIATVADQVGTASETEARRALRQLTRELDAVAAIDFFGSTGLERARAMLSAVATAVTRAYAPDEPASIETRVQRVDRTQYRGRVWATRRRIWADRVACAWLIRRFIDGDASFCWLGDVAACPADAVGFDFDGATFTHEEERCTFEVLVAAFGLEDDAGLARIAAVVHALDIGGAEAPEAAGFEALLDGTRERSRDDDETLARMSEVLDSYYAAFRR